MKKLRQISVNARKFNFPEGASRGAPEGASRDAWCLGNQLLDGELEAFVLFGRTGHP